MDDGLVCLALLGVFALRVGGVRQPLHLSGSTKRLFMLLATHANRGVRRERLIDEIWPDASPARGASALNTGVSRLRAVLTGLGGVSVDCIDDVVRLSVAPPAATDAGLLEAAVAAASAAETSGRPADPALRAQLEAAVAACRGEFLEGCDDHWVLPLRERYGALLIRALGLLLREAEREGDYERALGHGRRILELDPFREGTQRAMMRLYLLNGQRAQAIRQYRALAARLEAELSIGPMEETTALFHSIAGRSPAPPSGVSDPPQP